MSCEFALGVTGLCLLVCWVCLALMFRSNLAMQKQIKSMTETLKAIGAEAS